MLNIAFTYTIPPTSSPSSSKSGGNGSDEPSTYTRYFSVEDTYDDKSRDHSIFWMFFSNVHNNVLKPGEEAFTMMRMRMIMMVVVMMTMMSILTSAISASCSFYSYTPHFPSPSFLIPLL